MEWQERNERFQYATGKLSCQARRGHLADGVSIQSGDHALIRAFGLHDSEFLEQTEIAYTRGPDLFTTFQKDHVTAECYWRLSTDEQTGRSFSFQRPEFQLESIVSLRSSRLTTEPMKFSCLVENLSAGFRSLDDSPGGYLQPDTPLAWKIFVHPDDAAEVTLIDFQRDDETRNSGTRIDMNIPWMERGVIRRLRFLLAVWENAPMPGSMEKILEGFANSTIPLTT